ncbi:MAG TPA: hypothetical protein VK675_01725 [Candidatus Paceibacterota bacterium]|nr:hypothetical protein [Candidatus Paceibacterota bacterium]
MDNYERKSDTYASDHEKKSGSNVSPDLKPLENSISLESLKEYKNCVERLSNSFSSVAQIFHERSKQGFVDLIDPGEIDRMMSVIEGLIGMDVKGMRDLARITSLFGRLHIGIISIGTIRTRHEKDSVESLKNLAETLRQMREDTLGVVSQLKLIKNTSATHTAEIATRVADAILNRSEDISRMAENLSQKK